MHRLKSPNGNWININEFVVKFGDLGIRVLIDLGYSCNDVLN